MAIYIIYKRPVLDFPRVRDYNVGRLICVKEERKMKIHKNNTTHRGVSKRSTYFLLYTAIFFDLQRLYLCVVRPHRAQSDLHR